MSSAQANIQKPNAGIVAAVLTVAALIALAGGSLFSVSAAVFLLVSLFVIWNGRSELGLLSWECGIPGYYLIMLLILPSMTASGLSRSATDDEIADCLFVASAGLLAFFGGVILARMRGVTSAPSRRTSNSAVLAVIQAPSTLALLIATGAAALVWNFFYGYFGLNEVASAEGAGPIAGVIGALTFFMTVAHTIAWNRYFLTKHRRYLLLGVASAVVMFVSSLFSNSKGAMLLPFFLIALCQWGVSGRFPVKLVLLSLMVYLFLAFPLVTSLRYAFQTSGPAASRSDLAIFMIDSFTSFDWLHTTWDSSGQRAGASLGRGLQDYLARIVHDAGQSVPLFNGKTLSTGLEVFIPRMFYPDKPEMNIGHWTGVAFGMVDPRDTVTNLSPTYIGEFYMNFGVAGVIVGMFCLGVLARLIDRYVIVHRQNWTMPLMIQAVGWQEGMVGHTMLPYIKEATLLAVVVYVATLVQRDRVVPKQLA